MFWWYIILLFTITHSAGNPLAHYGAEGEVLQPRQLRRKDDVAQTLFFFVSPCHRCSLGVLKIRLMLFSFRSAEKKYVKFVFDPWKKKSNFSIFS